MNILLIGPPGSGKSTQADLLADALGVPHLNAGELFHYLSEEDTPRGREIKKIMESGGLVDDEFALKTIEDRLSKKQYQKGFVLDGAPRNLKQAKVFKIRLDKVFYLVVSDEENVKRLVVRGRKDDKQAIIKKRLVIYHQGTEPMLDYFRQQGILEEVDGERPIEVIHQDIMGRIKN